MTHLHSTLLCIAVHPKGFTTMWEVSHQHLDDATAATVQQRQLFSFRCGIIRRP